MNTYGPAQKKYYENNKDLIRGRNKKYKKQYNAWYYKKHKEELKLKREARELEKKIEKSMRVSNNA